MSALGKFLATAALICMASATAACSAASSSGSGGMNADAGSVTQSVLAATACDKPSGVGLILGAHQNAPAPQLSARTACEVTAAITTGAPVFIVVADGAPQVTTPKLVPVTGGTPAGRKARVAQNMTIVQAAISSARPATDGADDLGAFGVAADEARSLGIQQPQLILFDSGLDDRGPLNFTVPGTIAAEPRDVVHQLSDAHALPNLSGMRVSLVGLGYTTAPQSDLPLALRSNLTTIWSAVVSAAGSRPATIDPRPASGRSVATKYKVTATPIPVAKPVVPVVHDPIIFDAQSAVSFVADSGRFLDPSAANTALDPIAVWLRADPRRRAAIVGTTMDVGPLAGQQQLGQVRAHAVSHVLEADGVNAQQLQVSGVGSQFPEYQRPDKGADGTPLPAVAVVNRSVRITLSSPNG
jgi:outer membrane protein OmpA-like peptidoglycan-associated protein